MIRKTAVIAVLILVVSSFTLGSTERVRTVVAAGSEPDVPAYFTQERGLADFPPMAGYISAGHLQKMPRTVDAFLPLAGVFAAGHVRYVPDIAISEGHVQDVPDIAISEGHVQDVPDTGYTTMVIYMNDSRLERSAPPGFSFAVPGDAQPAGATGAVIMGVGHVPGNLTIKSRMAMLRPGAAPEMFDFTWDKELMGRRAEAGSFAVFSGHVMIPERNGSFEKASPLDFIRGPAAGAIELNSSLVVDLADLPVDVITDVNTGQTNDTYNDRISAGQTNWHAASIGSAVKSLNVDLKWRNPDGKLRLVIYTPDGKVLGPYYDDSDGKDDARINLNIANPSGVASGEWHLKVTDMATLGNDDYYVRTY